MRLGPQGFRLLTSGVGISGATHPATADGKNGRVQAIDLANRKLGWTTDLVNAPTTGLLATAGGVVFVGDLDPSLKAVDDTTGELLWSTKLDNAPSSGLVTYRVKDKQYLAVVVGMHNFHVDGVARSLDRLLAGDVASGGGAAAGGAPPAAAAAAAGGAAARGAAMTDGTKGGAAIWVFGL
jgi:outer membrane protein assembly factor BamB